MINKKTKFYLIIIAIIIMVILAGCGIATSLSYEAMIVTVLSYLIGVGCGGYIYKIYKQLKENESNINKI